MGVSFNKRVGAFHAYKGHKALRKNLGYYPTYELAREAEKAGRPIEGRIKSSHDRRGRPALEPFENMDGAGI